MLAAEDSGEDESDEWSCREDDVWLHDDWDFKTEKYEFWIVIFKHFSCWLMFKLFPEYGFLVFL